MSFFPCFPKVNLKEAFVILVVCDLVPNFFYQLYFLFLSLFEILFFFKSSTNTNPQLAKTLMIIRIICYIAGSIAIPLYYYIYHPEQISDFIIISILGFWLYSALNLSFSFSFIKGLIYKKDLEKKFFQDSLGAFTDTDIFKEDSDMRKRINSEELPKLTLQRNTSLSAEIR